MLAYVIISVTSLEQAEGVDPGKGGRGVQVNNQNILHHSKLLF